MLQVSTYHFFLFGRGISDGCVRFVNSDSETTRALPVKASVLGGQYNNSVESCAESCRFLGYPLAGMEFAVECCTCRLFDDLSFPDQNWLQKGAALVSAQALRW